MGCAGIEILTNMYTYCKTTHAMAGVSQVINK